MTEAEWLASSDPLRMLKVIQGREIASEDAEPFTTSGRKLRLFAEAARCDSCKILSRGDVAFWADSVSECVACDATPAQKAHILRDIVGCPWKPIVQEKAYLTDTTAHARVSAAAHAVWEKGPRGRAGDEVYRRTVDGLVFRESWLTPAVLSLARAAYEERPGRVCKKCRGTGKEMSPVFCSSSVIATVLDVVGYRPVMNSLCPVCRGQPVTEDGTLDPARLAVLSDALEEAGCESVPCPTGCKKVGSVYRLSDGSICPTCYGTTGLVVHPLLAHLRSPGPHVRGCWALDLILGLE